MFDFADEAENGFMCWNVQVTFCVFCPSVIVFKRYIERTVLKRENRKHLTLVSVLIEG